MEKSGSRPAARTTPLIIERPDLQSWQQRFVSRTLTLFFWGVWVYLWLPAVTLAGWMAGLERFHFHMVVLEGYEGLIELLAIYAVIIFILGATLIGWAKYNHMRFRGVERRKARPTVSVDALARQAHSSVEALMGWRGARIAVVHHHADGAIARVDVELADPVDSGPGSAAYDAGAGGGRATAMA